ncbi:MAG: hypothetical protein GKR94_01570 [Gammaproteobacteria bacterium]|nr:hypothetical protein [Gammaproteobacteria bacterium]
MSDEQLRDDDRQALIAQQTQACADVGLEALKRSDLVREMLSGDASQPTATTGASAGIKIEKKHSWRELRESY